MRTRIAVLGALAAAAVACQSQPAKPAAPAAAAAAEAGKNAPVARFGTTVITADELDKAIRTELNELEQRTYDLKKQGLDQLINTKLVEQKAKAAGKEPSDFLRAELTAKAGEPSEAEARALYERAKASKQVEEPFDKVKPQILAFLKNQRAQQALSGYLEQLRAEAKVEVLLPAYLPPKVEVAAVGPSKGADEKAPVTIVEFSDFQCPYCVKAEATVKDLMALEKYKGKIRLVYRDYPLPSHNLAPKASEAAHCAADQQKYWEMHDKLFAASPKLEVADLKAAAKDLGLDAARFDKCLDSGEKGKLVAESLKAGEEVGVRGTPAFFVNGRLLSGAQPLEAFTALVDAELAAKK